MSKPGFDAAVENLSKNFDIHSREFGDHVPEIYGELRERCPVSHSTDHGGYSVLMRYEDVRKAARDYGTFSSENDVDPDGKRREGIYIPRSQVRQGFLEMDPPYHSKLRRRLASWMSPGEIDKFEPRIRELAAEQIESAKALGSFDAMEDLASAFPAKVTLEFMGFPVEDWATYAKPLHEQCYIVQTSPEFAETAKQIAVAQERMLAMIAERREQPGTDLISILIAQDLDGEPLTDQLILDILWQFMGAGFDTVAGSIAFAMAYMTEHPDVRDRLAANPEAIPAAMEEMVRYFSPATGQARTVTGPTEVAGETFDDGDRVVLCWASANFDPAVFEAPEEMRIDRAPNPHLAFGDGVHKCLGARFARVEMRVFFEELFQRMPDFVVYGDAAEVIPSIGVVNGYIRMPGAATRDAAPQAEAV